MKHNRQTARDISYAYSARTYSGRAIIKILENITGRIGLIRKAKGYEHEIVLGESFWNIMLKRYGLSLEILDGNFSSIPKDGPLILVANHPFGILDGLILGYILSKSRQDFKILANQVFCKSDDLNDKEPEITKRLKQSLENWRLKENAFIPSEKNSFYNSIF